MNSDQDPSSTLADKPPSLEKALGKNQDVKGKVEHCAVELSAVNEAVKQEMAAGSTLLQVEKTLAQSENVEEKMHECIDELYEVNKVLIQEIDDRDGLHREFMETDQKLSATQNILSDTQDILAGVRQEKEFAHYAQPYR